MASEAFKKWWRVDGQFRWLRQPAQKTAVLGWDAGAAAERERIRQLALAGTEWLEPADLIPPRRSSREGDLWRRAQAVARREFAGELEEGEGG